MKRPIVRSIVFLTVLGVGAAIAIAVPRLPERRGETPTAFVTKGPLALTVHASGELRAGRTTTLVTPPVGGMLRIVRLLTTGVPVKAQDIIAEFDPADHQYALEQARSEVAEAEQEIIKKKADADAQAAQDQVTLLTARYDVRRAELDASGNEFVGAIDAQKNLLSLEEAKRRLEQLQEDVRSRADTSRASLAVVEEKRNKALLAMQRAQQVIESLTVKAPIDGVVSLKQNSEAMGGMMIWGMAMPEYREGDTIWPGRPLADVIESGRMELRAKVDENDRANLTEGQVAAVEIDTIPGETFEAKVGGLAAQARRADFMESTGTSRQFDVSFLFARLDPRMKAGASARVMLQGREIPDALTIPRQAVFQKNGKTHVFVKVGDRFERREVKVVQRSESRAAIEGLSDGTEIALVDPSARPSARPNPATASLPVSGGPR